MSEPRPDVGRTAVARPERGAAGADAQLLSDRSQARRLHRLDRVAQLDGQLGELYASRGQLVAARQHLVYSSTFHHTAENGVAAARVDVILADIHRRTGQLAKAQELATSARDTLARGGDSEIWRCDFVLGRIALGLQRYAEARRHLELAQAAGIGLNEATESAILDLLLAAADRGLGRIAEAQQIFSIRVDEFRRDGRLDLAAETQYLLAESHFGAGDWARAERNFLGARDYFARKGDSERDADCQMGLALILTTTGRIKDASALYLAARQKYLAGDVWLGVAECERRIADADYFLGRIAEASGHYTHALAIYREIAAPKGVADCTMGLACLARDTGEWTEADLLFLDARDRYERDGLIAEAARCDVERAVGWIAQAQQADEVESVRLRQLAAEALVPAALFVDAGRYALPSSERRGLWATNVASFTVNAAFRAAYATGDAPLLAELIMDIRSTGTYALAVFAHASDVDVSDPLSAEPMAEVLAVGEHALTASSAVCRLLGLADIRLLPSPLVRTPSNTLALRRQLTTSQTRYHATLRSTVVVTI